MGIPCRIHGFKIDKKVQKGILSGLVYKLTPRELVHSWVEVYYKNKWLNLEGAIVDKQYLKGVQHLFPEQRNYFCGYAIATSNFQNPPVDWEENDTFIQKEAIVEDLGVFAVPDDLYNKFENDLGRIRQFLFKHIIHKRMNRKVKNIRQHYLVPTIH